MVDNAILLLVDDLKAISTHLSKANLAYIDLLPWIQLYTPVQRTCNSKNLGIVTFNDPWCAHTSRDDPLQLDDPGTQGKDL